MLFLHVLQHANTLTSSNQGMMQSLWKKWSQSRRRTDSSMVKSSIHTEHCSPLSGKGRCRLVPLTVGIQAIHMTVLARNVPQINKRSDAAYHHTFLTTDRSNYELPEYPYITKMPSLCLKYTLFINPHVASLFF